MNTRPAGSRWRAYHLVLDGIVLIDPNEEEMGFRCTRIEFDLNPSGSRGAGWASQTQPTSSQSEHLIVPRGPHRPWLA
jgi:hypothetical protein